MSLEIYKKKRNFGSTPEPAAKAAKGSKVRSFVIQRHRATRLHYDFRLEADGVLKSWAIPRGPSLNPKDKRLAVLVEDHPVDYGRFEGVIPEGNYGAGIVEIWDEGTWMPEEMEKISDKEITRHIEKGMLKFNLTGSKIKGSFALVRIDGKNWLLIKHRDEFATDKAYDSEKYTLKSSPINKALAAEAKTTKTASPEPVKKSSKKSAAKKSREPGANTAKTPAKKNIGKKTTAKSSPQRRRG